MRFAIAYCGDNIAGKNIVERFKELAFSPQIPIIELRKDTIYSEDISEKKYPELRGIDFLIFASTHKSAKEFPSLCLHAPGNWRGNDLGGQVGKVCSTSSYVLKYLFKEFENNFEAVRDGLDEEYNLTLEVTHHGPLIDIPCCFIELGSNEKQWNDKKAAEIVAKTILSLQDFDKGKCSDWIPCIGIGGPHYAPNFNKIQLNSNYAIGHIIPEYGLPLTDIMLREAEEKTLEQVGEVLVDWKGCGKSEGRQRIVEIIEKSGLKVTRTKGVEK
jgi:D-aminoacyl-tRNA deacylase